MDNANTFLKVWAVAGPLLVAVVSAGWHFFNKDHDREWARKESIRTLSREKAEAHLLEARRLMALVATHAQTAVTRAINQDHEAAIDEIAEALGVSIALRLLTNPVIGTAASALNGAATRECRLVAARQRGKVKDEDASTLQNKYDAFVALCEAYLEQEEKTIFN